MTALRKPAEIAPPSPKGPALIFSFPSDLSARVRFFAAERRQHAQTMVAALIDYMLTSGMADDMLAELQGLPRPGQGRLYAAGQRLTHHQAAVLFLIGAHADADGACRLSHDKFAILAGVRPSVIWNVLSALAQRKLAERGEKERPRQVVPWRLTEAGRDVWCDLAGEAEQ